MTITGGTRDKATGASSPEARVTTYRNSRLILLFLSLFAASGAASTNQWPSNQVSGTATFRGAPLAGVTITAWNTNTNSIIQVTTTDANGRYRLALPAWINTDGTASADYHIWAIKPGYAFYPSVGAGAEVTRADHTGDFVGNGVTDIAIYFTVIHYVSLPDPHDREAAGPPLADADFVAYDGSNPLVRVVADSWTPGHAGWRKTEHIAQDRFTDNQDGTATDSVTGLIWLRDAGCFGAASWAAALTKVNMLASGACGLSDGSVAGAWRLPNIIELESVVDVTASDPALTRGHPFSNVSNGIYWSSTSYFMGQGGSPTAWTIRLADGRYVNDWIANDKATAQNEVWAVKGQAARLPWTGQYVTFAPGDDGSVRSGVPPTFPRWVDKGDGTVADTVTGLVWLKQADCIYGSWPEAMNAVGSLAGGQCGLSDGSGAGAWRMPSRSEMLSLSDRMENNHADFFDHTYYYRDGTLFQTAIFRNFAVAQYYWTATSDEANKREAWTVYSCDFGVYDTPKENVGYTLAVRSAATTR